ncbi:hypothetical protein [Myxosarcina sp. GI1(2024)]
MASEVSESIGLGEIPPLPSIVKPLEFPARRSLRQVWATVCSGSTGLVGNSALS